MNYIQIGKIAATHGIGGEIIILHALGKKTELKNIEALFIEEAKESYIPYFLEISAAKNTKEIICKIEGVNTKEAAHRFVRKNVWVSDADFAKLADKNAPLALLGYMVVDDGNALSEVEEVIEQPHQVLLKIQLKKKEILIPIHEETLDKIDRAKREIHVRLPDGLLDIYLQD